MSKRSASSKKCREKEPLKKQIPKDKTHDKDNRKEQLPLKQYKKFGFSFLSAFGFLPPKNRMDERTISLFNPYYL
jgi:hypothetical protein